MVGGHQIEKTCVVVAPVKDDTLPTRSSVIGVGGSANTSGSVSGNGSGSGSGSSCGGRCKAGVAVVGVAVVTGGVVCFASGVCEVGDLVAGGAAAAAAL